MILQGTFIHDILRYMYKNRLSHPHLHTNTNAHKLPPLRIGGKHQIMRKGFFQIMMILAGYTDRLQVLVIVYLISLIQQESQLFVGFIKLNTSLIRLLTINSDI